MKKNIREPRNAGCKELKPVYDDILHACDSIHYCTSHQAFEDKKFEILSSWSALVWKKEVYVALQKFKRYFIDQWLEGSFTNWQIFNTPPGYATTQNPEESFNKQIKDHYTEWECLTMLGAVECVFKIVTDYSTNQGDFALAKDKCNEAIRKAQTLNSNDFYVQDPNTLIYQNKYYINLAPRYCSCPRFIDVGTCKHHVGACLVMRHVDPNDREFLTIAGRGRPKKSAKGALKY